FASDCCPRYPRVPRALELRFFGGMIEAPEGSSDSVPCFMGDTATLLDNNRLRSYGGGRRYTSAGPARARSRLSSRRTVNYGSSSTGAARCASPTPSPTGNTRRRAQFGLVAACRFFPPRPRLL